jgi:hypothetical protein
MADLDATERTFGWRSPMLNLSDFDCSLVFLEANGAGKENHDQNATGDKYYFSDGKLIAAIAADGKSIDVKSAEAKKMSEKLQKESEAFRAAVK